MDQLALRKLSEAFARAAKPKKKRRRRRKKSNGPITEDVLLFRARNTLAEQLRLKHEGGSAKALASKLKVSVIDPDDRTSWLVSGGQCQHKVICIGGELRCTDHEPAHKSPPDGYACSHEIAVRRHLVRQIVKREAAA